MRAQGQNTDVIVLTLGVRALIGGWALSRSEHERARVHVRKLAGLRQRLSLTLVLASGAVQARRRSCAGLVLPRSALAARALARGRLGSAHGTSRTGTRT